jgi:hypothetical protein
MFHGLQCSMGAIVRIGSCFQSELGICLTPEVWGSQGYRIFQNRRVYVVASFLKWIYGVIYSSATLCQCSR